MSRLLSVADKSTLRRINLKKANVARVVHAETGTALFIPYFNWRNWPLQSDRSSDWVFSLEPGLALMAIKRADINLSTKPFSVKLRSKGQDVKVEVRPNHVLIPKSKNGKARTIPLSNVAKEIFADLLGDEAGFDYVFANSDTDRPYTNVGKAFGAACREAGIQDLTFHDLRHIFASRLREAGVNAITKGISWDTAL